MTTTSVVSAKQETKNGIRYHTTECKWKLQNLASLPKIIRTKGMRPSRECYKRTMFSVEVRFKSNATKEDCIDVQAKLERRDHQLLTLDTQLTLTLEDESENQVFESSCSSIIPANFKVDQPCMWQSMSMEVDQPEWFSFASNSLIVRVTVVISGCCLVINDLNPMYSNHHLNKLVGDFRRSYVDKIHSNVEIACGSHVLHAHKFMLCARSPVFRRELEHENEAMIQYESVDLGSCEHALALFMYYLYTDYFTLPQKHSTLESLYRIAKNYEVSCLQHICGQIMVSHIDLRSTCSIMIRAHNFEDETLKKICMEFIRDNFLQFRNTQQWAWLKQNKPQLYSEVLISFTGTNIPQTVREELLNCFPS